MERDFSAKGSIGLGAIIGAGIFTLSGTAIALARDWALFSFILVGFVAIVVALEVGELGSLFPRTSGASYSHVYEELASCLECLMRHCDWDGSGSLLS
jgi:APA family basic amino acid/polyamine antiporter